MFLRLLVPITFLFFSLTAFSGQINVNTTEFSHFGDMLLSVGPCGATIVECGQVASGNTPTYLEGSREYSYSGVATHNSSSFNLIYSAGTAHYTHYYNVSFTQINDGEVCSSNEECFSYAKFLCAIAGEALSDFSYTAPGDFSHACASSADPVQDCQDQVMEQCLNNLGISSSTYFDDGAGSQTCSGTCNDGTAATEPEECTLFNNYCDNPSNPSDIDGNLGSDVAPPDAGAPDNTYSVNYTPDGSSADPTAPLSTIQGDALINEVIKSRNVNAEDTALTATAIVQTIVEKSDDQILTLVQSGNGIIDAINDKAPFYDGGIIDAIESLEIAISSTNSNDDEDTGTGSHPLDGIAYNPSNDVFTDNGAVSALFDSSEVGTVKSNTELRKGELMALLNQSKNELSSYFSITATSSNQPNNLTLEGGWGTHNIAINRFADSYLSLKNIIIMLASMMALFIILGFKD
jgi:hypothetical protein